ncbi:non-ribosomal peptide synthetase [Paenibacillus ehimensis]|uniref:non-ribosomal peptide synthetase n=1 Tax=Paenibacillus ehimensis TaxID=79264 RepID=UPI00046FC155|nr:non-ribosomal peptide synthetase [Paenibacillus ehimensis]
MSEDAVRYYPLTQAQRRVWYTDLLYPNTTASILSATVKMKGKASPELLEQAMQWTIRQNDAFRIKIVSKDGELMQIVTPYTPQEIKTIDFSHDEKLPQTEAQAKAEAWLKGHNSAPGERLAANLYQFVILKIGPEELWYSFQMHHAICDGIAMILAINRISRNYDASLNGTVPEKKETDAYADCILAELDYEKSERHDKDQAFWADKYRELPQLTGMKSYNPLSTSTAAERTGLTLSDELYAGLKRFCQCHQVSAFTVFMAAFYTYVYKVTGESDVVIGAIFGNRTARKLKETVGMFASTVAARLSLNPEWKLSALIQNVSKEQSVMLRHQKYPYNKLIQDVRRRHHVKDIQRLFGISVEYQPFDIMKFERFEVEVHPAFCGHEANDFIVHIKEWPDMHRLELVVDYRTRLFDEKEIQTMLQQIVTVTEQILRSPDDTVADVTLAGEEEKSRLLALFTGARVGYPQEKTIHRLFEEQAAKTPERTALVCRGERITYEELNRLADRLAGVLRTNGIARGEIVALLADRSVPLVAGMLAVSKAGAAYLPLDPDYPEERIRGMLEDSGCTLVLTESAYAEKGTGGRKTVLLDREEEWAFPSPPSAGEEAGPSDLAYVIYTSGSTGKPKGVMIEHRSVHNFLLGMLREIPIDSLHTVLSLTTVTFDLFVLETLLPLMLGCTVVMASREEQTDPGRLADLCREHRVELLQATPSRLQLLLGSPRMTEALAALRFVLVGGEPLTGKLLERLREATQARVFNMYGPTETTVWATVKDVTDDAHLTIGRPIVNTRIYIVDEKGRLQPVGVPGELCIAGMGVARGYLGRHELTAERFVPEPAEDKTDRTGRMYRTGDRARYLADGTIEYLGRMDDQLKIRGYRIEPGEIVAVLSGHPLVHAAVVADGQEERGGAYLAAYYVSAEPISGAELREHIGRQLPAYMIPSYFIRLDSLPLTPNGKIDKKALPRPQASVAPASVDTLPRNDGERLLAGLWKEVLGLKEIGRHDNFLDLGVHSVHAAQLVEKIQSRGYGDIQLTDFFMHPTIASLSERLFGERVCKTWAAAAEARAEMRKATMRKQRESRGAAGIKK